jgi:hypothetical protein
MSLRRVLDKVWPDHPLRPRAERRVKHLSAADLLDWADVTGSTVAQALSRHRNQASGQALAEAVDGVLTLAVLIQELVDRDRA